MLKTFLGLFLMTFLICIFILLMQFVWMHVQDLVGKGVEISVLAEFFVYAVATLVPLALPLAILLASLMTFGNLGEHFELTAMKSAGVSLFRIMRPLAISIALVSVGAFYFSNNVLPISLVGKWKLGDTNHDTLVNMTDAQNVVNTILGKPTTGTFYRENADVSREGDITISDAVGIVNMILNDMSGSAKTKPHP